MKHWLKAVLVATSAISTPALAVDVAINIPLGQPGYYGQIQLGDSYPRPQLMLSTPTLAVGDLRQNTSRPLYLHVPPGHVRNWSKHCARYNACSRPAYFVKDSWYRDVYAPKYRERQEQRRKAAHDRHDDDHGHKHGGKGEHKGGHGKHGQGHDDHRGHRD